MNCDPEHVRALVLQKLPALGVKQSIPLPTIEPLSLRSRHDVARRLVILYALIGIGTDENVDPEMIWTWLEECNLHADVPAEEVSFFEPRELSGAERSKLAWRKEALCTLAWCGGIIDVLGPPDTESDLESLFPRIPPEINCDGFAQTYQLRSPEEIAVELDLHYCLHWVERHRGWFSFGRKFSMDIVRERRQALEWVGNAAVPWYEISLDT